MIKVYQFAPAWGLPNASPFCMKLETYLRMADIPYEIVPNADVRKAPKGKMPYIKHEGKVIGDSGLIIEYLKSVYGDKLDKNFHLISSHHLIYSGYVLHSRAWIWVIKVLMLDDENALFRYIAVRV